MWRILIVRKVFVVFFVFIMALFSYAASVSEIRDFFESYVNEANTYSDKVPDYYSPQAKIIRVVIKPNGERESVEFSFSDYLSQMKKRSKIARFVRYKNRYENIVVSDMGEGRYKISAIRYPMRDKRGLDSYFIVENTDGKYKIIEESMETPVQDFLKYSSK